MAKTVVRTIQVQTVGELKRAIAGVPNTMNVRDALGWEKLAVSVINTTDGLYLEVS